MFGLGRKDRLDSRLGHLEDEVSALRRHLADVEDTLTHRVGKLMARAKRDQGEGLQLEPLGSSEPNDQAPPPHPYPSLADLRRKMRGF